MSSPMATIPLHSPSDGLGGGEHTFRLSAAAPLQRPPFLPEDSVIAIRFRSSDAGPIRTIEAEAESFGDGGVTYSAALTLPEGPLPAFDLGWHGAGVFVLAA